MDKIDNTTVLEARDVTKEFNIPTPSLQREYIAAVDRVSLVLQEKPAKIVSLVGESGSGKTTLARMLLGLTPPTKGEILYRGTRVQDLKKDEWWDFRRNVQPIFQDPFGIYNQFMPEVLGASGGNLFLGGAPWAFVILTNGFVGASFGMIIFTSALMSIPEDLITAAKVDGASTWRIIRDIKLPLIKWPLLFIATYHCSPRSNTFCC